MAKRSRLNACVFLAVIAWLFFLLGGPTHFLGSRRNGKITIRQDPDALVFIRHVLAALCPSAFSIPSVRNLNIASQAPGMLSQRRLMPQ